MQITTHKEIIYRTGLSKSTIDAYLGHYSFNKFYTCRGFKLSDEFLQTLVRYLFKREKYTAINRVKKWIKEIQEHEQDFNRLY